MNILIVLTSHGALGATGLPTGFWLEELAAPYYVFKDAGAAVILASPKGGLPPVDPKSAEPAAQSDATRRFAADIEAQAALGGTIKLAEVKAADFDAVYYAGGHGPLWDLAQDKTSQALIEAFWANHKPVAAVCHGPAALRDVMADGAPLAKGRSVTGFSNSEEAAAMLTAVVPFALEDELKRLGGLYSKGPDGGSFVQIDGNLVTGQNPASSAAVAEAVLGLLDSRETAAP